MLARTHYLIPVFLAFVGLNCNDAPAPIIDARIPFATTPPPVSVVTTAETKIVAPNGNASDLFGFSVALSGDTLVVGTPYEDSVAQDAGAAFVFVRVNGVWQLEQKLLSPDAGAGRWFGYSVAIEGNKVLIGTPQADGNSLGSGVVYVFLRSNGVWIPLPVIAASDGKSGDMFGQAVDISGNSLLVGCPQSDAKGTDAGAAYVFAWNGTSYIEQKKILTLDSKAGDHFGAAVAMNGETAVIGAPDADLFGMDSGTAYVFFREGTLWSQQKKLVSPNGAAGDGFGWAVDIELDTAIVGSPKDDTGGTDAGATYAFQRTGISWNPFGNLKPQGLAADDRFGSSVAMSGNYVVVGALLDDTAGMNAGAAYLFSRNGSSFLQEIELLASDAAIGDAFGFAVAISGQTTAVSAYLDDDLGTSSGATYVYELKNDGGEGCITGAECLSGFCADGVCCDNACDAGPCDACTVATGSNKNGVCTLLSGPSCDDGDACTQTDTCLSGQCMGGNPKMCAMSATCAGTSTCDPATGQCMGDIAPNGSSCDDENACTSNDVCQGGVCQGVDAVLCEALDECHSAGVCDPKTAMCSTPVLPDGTICSEGVCQAGTCVRKHDSLLFTGGCVCRASSLTDTRGNNWGIVWFVFLSAIYGMRRRDKRSFDFIYRARK